jgi:adenine-specific DNA-methyltransferase
MSPKKNTPAKTASRKVRHSAARIKSVQSDAGSARHAATSRVPAKISPSKGQKKSDTSTKLDPVAEYRHGEAKRKNNPPAKIAAEGTVPVMGKIRYEYSPRLSPALRFDPTGAPDALPELLQEAQRRTLTPGEAKLLADALRNQEPWLEWASKREKRHFEVDPVALHIHERVGPHAILRVAARQDVERSLFGDPEQSYNEAVQFYRYEVPWTNRLILGDSLQVMTSLARREDLAGKVQMIYLDPPYGINFKSNFQATVGNSDVKDKDQDLTREAEVVRAYRDTWNLGIHSYLTYLRDRLLLARELLGESGSIFVQISDQNVHRVREITEDVFGLENFVSLISFRKTTGQASELLPSSDDFIIWFARDKQRMKYRQLHLMKTTEALASYSIIENSENGDWRRMTDAEVADNTKIPRGWRVLSAQNFRGQGGGKPEEQIFEFEGRLFDCSSAHHWKTNASGRKRVAEANRLLIMGSTIYYKRYIEDHPIYPLTDRWVDTAIAGFSGQDKLYAVYTAQRVIERCILMTSDPGDLVLDPTCGSGTTAYVAEQLGRRWITVDTSRVAIAIARQRLLTSKFDFYRLRAESEGVAGNFAYKTVPHVGMKGSIAQNQNLDPIFAKHRPSLDEALRRCNDALSTASVQLRQILRAKLISKQKRDGRKAITDSDRRRWEFPELGKGWEHWQVPFEADADWPPELQDAVRAYRKAWRAKMDEVNACIAANADQEDLVDQPEVVRGVTRVSGPFTVEAVQPPEMSLSNPTTITSEVEFDGAPEELETFPPFEMRMVETRLDQEEQNLEAYLDQMIRYLKMDGVRFPNNKQMKFSRLEQVLDGSTIHAEGRWANGDADPDPEGRANVAVVYGPQYGPVTAKQVEESIRTANQRGYDHLVVAGFSFDGAATAVISEAGHPKLKIHQAHIRPDVNPGMEGLLKEQPGSQLFSVFGLPRTRVDGPNGDGEFVVEMEGVDIYDPVKNLTLPTNADKVAAWFLDGDYDGRCFCITQAFFPDKSAWEKLSKALTGVVDPERFNALSGTRSLPFPAGKHRCVAVKVIDPRGNEVMTVNRLEASRGR